MQALSNVISSPAFFPLAYLAIWLYSCASALARLLRFRQTVERDFPGVLCGALTRWGTLTPERIDDADAIDTLVAFTRRNSFYHNSLHLIGIAVGYSLCLALAAWLLLPPINVQAPGFVTNLVVYFIKFVVCVLVLYCGLPSLAYSISSLIAARTEPVRLQETPRDSAAFDKERTGRVADYRTPLLLLPSVGFLLITATLLLRFYLAKPPVIVYGAIPTFLQALWFLEPQWLLFVVPVTMGIYFVVAEIRAKLQATDPQRALPLEATLAREVDRCFRADAIGAITASEIQVLGVLTAGQFLLLNLDGVAGTNGLVLVAIYLFVTIGLVSIFRRIVRQNGRLGGRLTGWSAPARLTYAPLAPTSLPDTD